MKQMMLFAENKDHYIAMHSNEFMSEYLDLVRLRFKGQSVDANEVYQEYIQAEDHMHLNATRWSTLTDFIFYLARQGKVKVEERENGLYISLVDQSVLDAIREKEEGKVQKTDEERERLLLKKQIERAHAEAPPIAKVEYTEFNRDDQKKIQLSLKPVTVRKKLPKNKILK
jgi:DNA/RNA-binding protein KIN17